MPIRVVIRPVFRRFVWKSVRELFGGLQVSTGILCKSQERGGLRVPGPESSVRGEFERLLSILNGARDIAKRQGAVSPGGSDRSWQRAKFHFIHDDHIFHRLSSSNQRSASRKRDSLASSSPLLSNAQA
jgi:hypothetical protein